MGAEAPKYVFSWSEGITCDTTQSALTISASRLSILTTRDRATGNNCHQSTVGPDLTHLRLPETR